MSLGGNYQVSGGTLLLTGCCCDASNLTVYDGGIVRQTSEISHVLSGLHIHNGSVEVGVGTELSAYDATTLSSKGTLTVLGTFSAHNTVNDGQINLIGTSSYFMDGTVNNAGAQINIINAAPHFSTMETSAALVNFGTLNLINAYILGDIHSPTGSSIQVAGDVTFEGHVSGAADFPGSGLVVFKGGYEPGDSPAEVFFNGGVVFGKEGALAMELAGDRIGEDYDRLVISGSLHAGGTLQLILLDGYQPETGACFDLFDFGVVEDAFMLKLPRLTDGRSWDTSSLYTTGQIGVVPEPTTLLLVASGMAGLIGIRPRRSTRNPTRVLG